MLKVASAAYCEWKNAFAPDNHLTRDGVAVSGVEDEVKCLGLDAAYPGLVYLKTAEQRVAAAPLARHYEPI